LLGGADRVLAAGWAVRARGQPAGEIVIDIDALRDKVDIEQRPADRLELAEELCVRLEAPPEEGGGDLADAEEAAYHCHFVIQVLPREDWDWLRAHYILGFVYAAAWAVSDETDDLDKAIDAFDTLNETIPAPDTLCSVAELRLRRAYTAPKSDLATELLTRAIREAEQARLSETDELQRVEAETVSGLVMGSFVDLDLDPGPLGLTQPIMAARAIFLLTKNLSRIGTASRYRYQALLTLAELHYKRSEEEALRSPNVDRLVELDLSLEYRKTLAESFDDTHNAQAVVRALALQRDPVNHNELRWRLGQIADRVETVDAEHMELLAEAYLGQAKVNGDTALLGKATELLERLLGRTGGLVVDDDLVTMAWTLAIEAYALSPSTTVDQLVAAEDMLPDIVGRERANGSDTTMLEDMGALLAAELALRTMDPARLMRAKAALRQRLELPPEDAAWTTTMLAAMGTLLGLDDPQAPVPSWSLLGDLSPSVAAEIADWLADRRVPDAADRAVVLTALGFVRTETIPAAEQTPTTVCGSALAASVAELEAAHAALPEGSLLRLLTLRKLAALRCHLGVLERDLTMHRQGISELDAVLGHTPAGHPMRSSTLALLAMAMLTGSTLGRLDRDLAYARTALIEAVEMESSAEERSQYLFVLALVDVTVQHDLSGRQDLMFALTSLRRAVDLLPRGRIERVKYRRSIAELLIDRYQRQGGLHDIEEAIGLLRATLLELPEHEPGERREVQISIAMAEAEFAIATDAADAAARNAVLTELLAERIHELENDPTARWDLTQIVVLKLRLALALVRLAGQTGDDAVYRAAAQQATETAGLTRPGSILYLPAHTTATLLDCGIGVFDRDYSRFRAALARLAELGESADEATATTLLGLIGMAYLAWAAAFDDRGARDIGIDRYERSCLPSTPGFRFTPSATLLGQIAEAYWSRGGPGDAERAIEAGLNALREQAISVVLQADPDRALIPVADASRRASALAARCLAIGLRADAVRAIEAGRGLVLYAVSWTADVSSLLRAADNQELAEEWDRNGGVGEPEELGDSTQVASSLFGAGAATPTVPEHLRYRVIRALAAVDSAQVLAAPPSVDDIAAALRALDLDVLMYLVPALGERQGRALLVTAVSEVVDVVLPLLRDSDGSPIPSYVAARQAVEAYGLSEAEKAPLDRTRQRKLVELCRWAQRVAIGPALPHLRRAAGDRLPRLAVVPTGALNVVPWHAARADSPAGPRYAIEDAVFSYVSSARQLCALAVRPRRFPGESPVIVADPTGTLLCGPADAHYLHRFYPHARFYGNSLGVPSDGAGTPEQVLRALPTSTDEGTSLLHLGCHAISGATPSTSLLKLARDNETGDETLTMERILRWAQRAAAGGHRRDGGLVVLAACQSNLTQAAHDEGLTLCSAFIAAGATGVTATLWAVGDQFASVLLCRYHEAIAVGGARPMDALREAQLWALTKDRDQPAALGAELAPYAASPELCDEVAWAAYSHCGW
jgi:tetratricopeptide (TPR) repeat protein